MLDKFQRTHIAKETLALYELARRRFAQNAHPMYLKPKDHALSDAAVFLYSFDRMLYDMLYQYSWRWRFTHWIHLGWARPRLFMWQPNALLSVARSASRLVAKNQPTPAFVRWLEQQIADKQPVDDIWATHGMRRQK